MECTSSSYKCKLGQTSCDSVMIWWNSTEDLRPVTKLYCISLNVKNKKFNATDRNIIITDLSPCNYSVTIIPENVIGYGPSANINVTIVCTAKSTIMCMTVTEYITSHNTNSIYSTASLSTELVSILSTTMETASSNCDNSKELSISFQLSPTCPYSTCTTKSNDRIVTVAVAVPVATVISVIATTVVTFLFMRYFMIRRFQRREAEAGDTVNDIPLQENVTSSVQNPCTDYGDDHSTPASTTPSPVKVSQVYNPEQVKRVLKENLPDLSNVLAMHMSVIGIRLYSKGLIPLETYESTITSNVAGREKANSLLLTLKATIDAKPQLMKTLIDVLKKSEVAEAVAAKIEREMSIN